MAIEKGGIYPTEGIIYGVRRGKPWALIKHFGKTRDDITQIWIWNPAQIKDCEKVRIVDIIKVYTTSRIFNGRKYLNTNADVMAMPAEQAYRATDDGKIVTPDEDIAKFLFGIQGGR